MPSIAATRRRPPFDPLALFILVIAFVGGLLAGALVAFIQQ
jgi:uncharacterized protein involved in exopolysaccharide biosynthesis